jgi:hypothetical protein
MCYGEEIVLVARLSNKFTLEIWIDSQTSINLTRKGDSLEGQDNFKVYDLLVDLLVECSRRQ